MSDSPLTLPRPRLLPWYDVLLSNVPAHQHDAAASTVVRRARSSLGVRFTELLQTDLTKRDWLWLVLFTNQVHEANKLLAHIIEQRLYTRDMAVATARELCQLHDSLADLLDHIAPWQAAAVGDIADAQHDVETIVDQEDHP